jgi:hypothetical protein
VHFYQWNINTNALVLEILRLNVTRESNRILDRIESIQVPTQSTITPSNDELLESLLITCPVTTPESNLWSQSPNGTIPNQSHTTSNPIIMCNTTQLSTIQRSPHPWPSVNQHRPHVIIEYYYILSTLMLLVDNAAILGGLSLHIFLPSLRHTLDIVRSFCAH